MCAIAASSSRCRTVERHRRAGRSSDLSGRDRESNRGVSGRRRQLHESRGREPEDHPADTGPEHGTDTHRARLTRRIERPVAGLIEEVLPFQHQNEGGLGMSGQVVIGVHPIPGFRDNLPVDLEESAERMVAGCSVLRRRVRTSV